MRPRVLVVEDEFALRRATAIVLSQHFDVKEASGMPEAIPLAKETMFDVVVTDYSMPGGDGALLAQTLRDLGQKCRVIIVTAVHDNQDVQKALEAGLVQQVMSKPWNAVDLVERVRRLAASSLST